MKIGILTYHNAHNYGAVLQCYALKETLKSMGHEVNVIDYHNSAIDKYYVNNRSFNLRNIIINLLHGNFSKISSLRKKDQMQKEIVPLRSGIFEGFQQRFLDLFPCIENKIPSCFDAYVIGSDMLWDDVCLGGRFDKVYWGDFEKKKSSKVVGYAISGTPKSFKKCADRFSFDFLKNFTSFSVRENKLKTIIEDTINKPVNVCLDPTLITEAHLWDGILNKNWANKKYILTYFLSLNKVMREELTQKTRILAQEKGYEVIDLDVDTKPINVEDFVSLIKFAQYVITDSFHGTAFSLIFNKSFHVLRLNKDHDARYADVLERLGMNNLLVSPEFTPEFPIIDYESVNKLYSDMKRASLEYLNISLS